MSSATKIASQNQNPDLSGRAKSVPQTLVHRATYRVKLSDGSAYKLVDGQAHEPPALEFADLCILIIKLCTHSPDNRPSAEQAAATTPQPSQSAGAAKEKEKEKGKGKKCGYYIWCGLKNRHFKASGSVPLLSPLNSCSLSIPKTSKFPSATSTSEVSSSLFSTSSDDTDTSISRRLAKVTKSPILFTSDVSSLSLKYIADPQSNSSPQGHDYNDFSTSGIVAEKCILHEITQINSHSL
ncbi:hypothetical protein AYI69_g5588 [Smittium culicis]|uniref:Uncharacterized protein n=1 Tax=Smittium culicis TaxID=133412 RepID=A0A1R1Y4Z5_9FUNG|nr:hypothetical protein AYI69_g5588 [Smittium culicis]